MEIWYFFFWKYHWKIIEIFRGLSVGTLIRWCAACNDVWALVRELMGVPMQPTPQMILHEWYHFVQGTLRNHISDITRKNWDSLLISAIFQNGRLKIWDFQYLGNYFMWDHDFGVWTYIFLVRESDKHILQHEISSESQSGQTPFWKKWMTLNTSWLKIFN